MFVTCLRYARNREEAEETLQEGFMKVFDNLLQYKFTGSLEGWVRRIMVNCALRKYRIKSHLHAIVNFEETKTDFADIENIYAELDAKVLIKLVQ